MNKNETAVVRNGHLLSLTRTFDAPKELVWEAWTTPERLNQWWGPDGFTITTQEFKMEPGGIWRFVMHGPDGVDYPNKIKFVEVSKPDRIAYQHMDDVDVEPVSFSVTVLFEAAGTKTRLTMHSVFSSAEILDRVVKDYGAIEGGKQTLARLAAFLETLVKL
jgi:uncharacterized protein YndB with AHSA1/START domain